MTCTLSKLDHSLESDQGAEPLGYLESQRNHPPDELDVLPVLGEKKSMFELVAPATPVSQGQVRV